MKTADFGQRTHLQYNVNREHSCFQKWKNWVLWSSFTTNATIKFLRIFYGSFYGRSVQILKQLATCTATITKYGVHIILFWWWVQKVRPKPTALGLRRPLTYLLLGEEILMESKSLKKKGKTCGWWIYHMRGFVRNRTKLCFFKIFQKKNSSKCNLCIKSTPCLCSCMQCVASFNTIWWLPVHESQKEGNMITNEAVIAATEAYIVVFSKSLFKKGIKIFEKRCNQFLTNSFCVISDPTNLLNHKFYLLVFKPYFNAIGQHLTTEILL